MLAAEIITLALVTWLVIFLRLKPLVWTVVMAGFLAAFTVLPPHAHILSIVFWAIYGCFAVFANIKPLRMLFFTRPFFMRFKKILPPMSSTEREALEAGDTWWEGDLFQGSPNWKKLHAIKKPSLTIEEQAFVDNEVETLCKMINDWQIVSVDRDMPPEVWQYLKDNRFFGMVIDKKYGGRGFSALAHSTVVTKIATSSFSVAVNTMVPNSLGPGELLHHYGTEAQKDYYLPRLAKGEEIPCFGLTSTVVGSDASKMTDTGVICMGQHEGKEVLGINLNFEKRYITLAPVATVVGLAFNLLDPDHLLGDKENIGITVCLLPTSQAGVNAGERHFPGNMAFMNGPVSGKDVFIPIDWIIGGAENAGTGWRMLMECLSIGRGISLPSLSAAGGMLNTRTTGAYARLRKQFRQPIGNFEGVQEAMARIGGMTYILEACRRMTAGAVDLGIRPSVASAIAKYHCTEMNRQTFNDAMDVQAGRAVQAGPRNYITNGYSAIPMSITVEGANILTRSLIVFGQGAVRCHPYVFHEMEAAAANNLRKFDCNLLSHLGYTMSNIVRLATYSLTNGHFTVVPHSPLAYYYRQLSRMSTALAVVSDFAMLTLGGALKRKESLSARLGDVLSALYLASTVLKYHADHNSSKDDLPMVKWALETCLANIQIAFDDFFRNFPSRGMAKLLKFLTFPYGRSYQGPSDKLTEQVAQFMMQPSQARDRLTHLCYIGSVDKPVGRLENAFNLLIKVEPLERKLKKAVKDNIITFTKNKEQLIAEAVTAHVLTPTEGELVKSFEAIELDAMQVDNFAAGTL
tara:strand:- start:38872 stop:41277 length:2406 start_codon:yes stop_codon:yes gene_type:complete